MKSVPTAKDKRAKEALEKSEERAQLIFENMRDNAWLMDMDLKTTWASPSTVRTRGFKPEDLQGSTLDRHMTPASMTRLTELIAKHLTPDNLADKRREVVIEGDFEFYRKDGTAFWGDTVATLLRKRDGTPEGFLFVVRDITERTRAEASLREKELNLKALFDFLPVGVAILDKGHRVSFINSALEKILEISKEGLFRGDYKTRKYLRSDRTPMPPEEFASARAIKEQRAVHDIETGVVKEDGAVIWTSVSAVPVTFSEWLEVVVVRDITERKRAEATIQASEARYRMLVENAGEAIIVAQDGLLKFVNQTTLNMTGYSETELISRPFPEFIHPDDRERVVASYWKRLAGKPAQSRYDVRLLTRAGSFKWVEIGAALIDWEGRPATLNFLTDISDRHKAEEVIQASLREKEVMLREIHHRVKNNMQVISSLFNLQAGKTASPEYREILKEGQTRIRAMSLVHEKLYQSRDLSKIDLAVYIQGLADHLFNVYLTDSNRIRLETDLEEVPLDINSAVPCGLILNELISNSLKHAFPEGRKGLIRIGLKRGPDDTIILRVANDGIELPKDLDFRQSESLGLQIVNLLVRQLEGSIELDRTNGTTFTVTFREIKDAPRP